MSADTEPATAVRALIVQNEVAVQHLRAKAMPHHLGMAAACRALAAELPETLARHLDEDLASGALADRWRHAQVVAREAAAEGEDPTLAAIGLMLEAQRRAVVRHIALRGKVWTAEVYRLEGQADALEAQTEKLRRLAPPVDAASETEAAEDSAAPSAPAASAPAAGPLATSESAASAPAELASADSPPADSPPADSSTAASPPAPRGSES
ncbi:MAG TPA: hypothetical protein VFP84_10630 [Kofleriaceae bacterium]|nr:hypothetical protein [Kofleriaceae bacterium]